MDQIAQGSNYPELQENLEVDVVIIGAGFTGLWTAYYLNKAQPSLSIAILEAKQVGFGASGRNGGWLMGEIAGADKLLKKCSKEKRQASHHLLHNIPDEVAHVCHTEGINCDLKKAGALHCAVRYPEQTAWLHNELAEFKKNGYGQEDFIWLDKDTLKHQLNMPTATGALFTPNVATIHPAKLVTGLAKCLNNKGIKLYENTEVTNWQSGEVKTNHVTVNAQWVVPAVEAYAAQLKPLNHYQLAVYSLIIATEPLSEEIWDDIGLENGQAFCESSHLVNYGQRTADDRLVFGARGGYRFGGRLRHDFTLTDDEIAMRENLLHQCFPILKSKKVKVSHAWGGNLSMPRRFHPHMLCDRKNGIALAGGYLGEGVGATNLAGRTLADLILNKETITTQQPWVLNNKPLTAIKKWEPEPFRWLAYKALNKMSAVEDNVLSDLSSPKWKRKIVIVLYSALSTIMS